MGKTKAPEEKPKAKAKPRANPLAKAPNSVGAPAFEYTEELAREICTAVAISTLSLHLIIKDNPHFPSEFTIRRWRLFNESFGSMYARAKQMQAELFAEEILEISDDGTNDWMERLGDDGTPIGWQLNGEHIQRSRLRIDSRKWIACKLAPRIYGDKQVVENHNFTHESGLKELE